MMLSLPLVLLPELSMPPKSLVEKSIPIILRSQPELLEELMAETPPEGIQAGAFTVKKVLELELGLPSSAAPHGEESGGEPTYPNDREERESEAWWGKEVCVGGYLLKNPCVPPPTSPPPPPPPTG